MECDCFGRFARFFFLEPAAAPQLRRNRFPRLALPPQRPPRPGLRHICFLSKTPNGKAA
jgi:hypothetical protein